MSVFNESNVEGIPPESIAVSGAKPRVPLIPKGDVVIIEVEPEPTTTAGGLIVPESPDDGRPHLDPRLFLRWGRVLSVGDGSFTMIGARMPVRFQLGEMVFAPANCVLPLSPGLMRMLEHRGIPATYSKKLGIVQCHHITGIITDEDNTQGTEGAGAGS